MQDVGLQGKIDLAGWKRREHFEHFCRLDNPFWSLVVDVDCTSAAAAARSSGWSFFLLYLHASLQAANRVPEFGWRIIGDEVRCYGPLHASATIMRDDETFGCCFIEYRSDFMEFAANAQRQIELVKARDGMCLENDLRHDQVYFSSLPWLKFSALTFACNLKTDSVPKIIFGQASLKDGKKLMPVALQVHHALIDGRQVARFFDLFQQALNNC
ncbi:MAG: chloramphenicol acetyltransferase [Chloroflexi bacterium HGW-Chloroflexi-5]|jgi:chloramphenicol O-acetyltransferase type A|nr:MAG: chloramphenicol acetyltransferase [Chloroflexi bacterium HGW-Chloroflexi-5]